MLGEQAMLVGEPHLALSHLERFLNRHSSDRGPPEGMPTWGLALFAQIIAELGDTIRAREYLRRIVDERMTAQLDNVQSVRALVAARQRQWDKAEQHAREALAFARRSEFIVSEARLLYVWGRWLIDQGNVVGARERLDSSLAIFVGWELVRTWSEPNIF